VSDDPVQSDNQKFVKDSACLNPDYWLEVSLYPEGLATGNLDQGFPWFSSILEEMLSWYPHSTLLHMQPSQR
jgi:hypothetical protein